MQQVAAGVYYWTTPHPEWKADSQPGSPDDWPQAVGSVAFTASDHLVLVDPLIGHDGWAELDALVESHAKPVVVFTTVGPHVRSRAAVCERYAAQVLSELEAPPDGLEWVAIKDAGETMVWLPRAKALIPGDRLLGDGHGGLQMCPSSWLDHLPGIGMAELREGLKIVLRLPVRLVLVSHGEPVLRDGRAAVATALTD